ncbi:MAG: flagellar biosynthesis protein FliQ [Desulfobulbaceae bacterium]|nr:flagellar biosynthesis protein FliQ [Desulfobulbaceae bacterium]
MNQMEIVSLAKDAMLVTLMVASPMLMIGMVVGVVIAVFQSVTQIQEMTLTFVPKIVAIMLGMLFFASWMLTKLTDYTTDLITRIPDMIR